MTLEAIRNVEFNRGRGYRSDEVDEFIDECIETVEALQRENETLNQKMKVLADKISQYRMEEDNIRAALLSAQRAGDIVLREANEKAAKIVEEANEKARHIREDAVAAIGDEQHELKRIQNEVEAFKARMLSLYKEHLSLINAIPETVKTEELPAKAADTPVEQETVAPKVVEVAVVAETPEIEEAPVVESPVVEPPVFSAETNVVVTPEEESAEEPETDEEVEMKPISRFVDLKFGANYNIADDDDEEDTGKRSHNPFRKKK